MREKQQRIREADLQRWRLIERFQALLGEEEVSAGSTWEDKRRRLQLGQYLSTYLFGLFNPVVSTMRGLCAATQLTRVQEEVSGRAVSLGSFSEAQAVVELSLLESVFGRLAQLGAEPAARGPVASVVDSTVMRVLPRMQWALWRRQNGAQNAVRLHVEFDLARDQVKQAHVTRAKTCERAEWRRLARPGSLYIGDRYYSYDYELLGELQGKGVDFVVRLRLDTQWVEESLEELTPADRAAGVTWAGAVRLGKEGTGPRVRVVQVLGEEETILLATTVGTADAPAELLAALYRHRWQVEVFFRWLKCILGCRHWFAESERGVTLQVYLALIAAQLLMLYTGRRPNRRQMETIQFYLMGWATAEELIHRVMPTVPKKP